MQRHFSEYLRILLEKDNAYMFGRRIPRALTALTLTALTGLAHASTTAARADTVAVFTGGPDTNGKGAYQGQSFTTVTSGPENNIVFSFESTAGSTANPIALGDGFLLSSEYLGSPGSLSSSTPGFLGEAAASGNAYTFAPGLTLQSGVQYFLYSDAFFPAGSLTGNGSYSGGQFYGSPNQVTGFSAKSVSLNFLVTGTPAAITTTPEPASYAAFAMGGFGLLGLGLKARKRSV